MNTENLLQQIKLEFSNVSLGDNYTLPEEDYADTSRWHFDKTRVDLNLTEQEWADQEIHLINTSGWLPEERQEAINAIKEKRRMLNRYPNPIEIPSIYLDRYATGFGYLTPKAYLFYTPAIMIYILSDSKGCDSVSFTSWLNRLSWANNYELITDLLKYFDNAQVCILIDFLMSISRKTDMNFDSTKIEICLNNMTLLNGINHLFAFNRA